MSLMGWRKAERKLNIFRQAFSTRQGLLPPSCLRLMQRAFTLSNLLAATPFQWKSGQFSPTRGTTGWRKFMWAFNFVLSSCQFLFAVIQLYRTMTSESSTLEGTAFSAFTLAWCTYNMAFQVAHIMNRDILPMFTRCYIGFYKDLKAFPTRADSLQSANLSKLVVIMVNSTTVTFPIFYGCVAYVKPTLPAFWSSLVPEYHGVWQIRVLLAFIEGYVVILPSYAGTMYVSIGFPFFFTLLDVVRLMSARVRDDLERDPMPRLFGLYQQLRLLALEYEKMYTLILISTKMCLISFGMASTFGIFRTEGVMRLLFGAVGGFSVVILIVYMMLLGELHSQSTTFLSVVKNETGNPRMRDRLWVRKQLRAMPEMKVKVGSMYFIDKPMVMTVCQILFDNCINVLLMTA